MAGYIRRTAGRIAALNRRLRLPEYSPYHSVRRYRCIPEARSGDRLAPTALQTHAAGGRLDALREPIPFVESSPTCGRSIQGMLTADGVDGVLSIPEGSTLVIW